MTRNYRYEPESYNDQDDYYNDHHETRTTYLQPTHRRGFKENASIGGLMVAGTGLMLVDISLHNMIMASLAFFTAGVALMPRQANSILVNFDKLQRKYRIDINTILFCVIGTIFLLDMVSAPANAQFMNNAETFFKDANYFGDVAASPVIGFIFAILRGLFLLYLGISLVQVVQKARNDEDWQTIARTPIIVAITVVVGDVLAGLVVGGAP
ncbi:MAG: hypothetical protein HC815_05945 [Richelia sp. RM1_1_1]|nr:hypothetical protein [Richelia sp. RM1_1_1]